MVSTLKEIHDNPDLHYLVTANILTKSVLAKGGHQMSAKPAVPKLSLDELHAEVVKEYAEVAGIS